MDLVVHLHVDNKKIKYLYIRQACREIFKDRIQAFLISHPIYLPLSDHIFKTQNKCSFMLKSMALNVAEVNILLILWHPAHKILK